MHRRLAAPAWLPWPGAWPLVGVLVVAAMYGCVPETDHLPAVAALVVLVGVLELVAGRRLPLVVYVPVVLVMVAALVHGAAGQSRAWVGGVFAWWPAVLPLALAVLWPGSARRHWLARWAVVAVAAVAAAFVARTGALDPGVGPALRSIAIAAPASLALATAALK